MPKSGRGHGDVSWVSLLDWIPEPKGLVVQNRKRLHIISHRGESTECGITKLGVRSGSQLLMRVNRLKSVSPAIAIKSTVGNSPP